jgi:hypothetical protein
MHWCHMSFAQRCWTFQVSAIGSMLIDWLPTWGAYSRHPQCLCIPRTDAYNLKMERANFSETLANFCQTPRHHIPEELICMSSHGIRNLLLLLNYCFSFFLSSFIFYPAPLLVLCSIMFDVVLLCLLIWCPDISLNTVDRLGVDDPGICIRFSVGLEILPLSMVTRPTLGSRHLAMLQLSVLVESGVVLNSL